MKKTLIIIGQEALINQQLNRVHHPEPGKELCGSQRKILPSNDLTSHESLALKRSRSQLALCVDLLVKNQRIQVSPEVTSRPRKKAKKRKLRRLQRGPHNLRGRASPQKLPKSNLTPLASASGVPTQVQAQEEEAEAKNEAPPPHPP